MASHTHAISDKLARRNEDHARQASRIFVWLLPIQLVFVVFVISLTQEDPAIHAGHTAFSANWASILFAVALTIGPGYLAWKKPATASTRLTVGLAQLTYSGLIIHVTGGRIESHFHIFASLALLAFYRDWRVIVAASALTAGDHLLRGVLLPESIFGSSELNPILVALEHAGWVVFMDIFLLLGIRMQNRAAAVDAEREVTVEELQKNNERQLLEAVSQVELGSSLHSSTESATAEIESITGTIGSFDDLITNLREIIGRTAEQGEESERQFADLQEQADKQSAYIEQSVSSVRQMVVSMEEMSRVADEQKRSFDTVVQQTREGSDVMRQTGQLLGDLDEASAHIAKLVEVINDVAERTRLLGMNAAIEASHAGSSGSGFAVVAAEIRKLSSETTGHLHAIDEYIRTSFGRLKEADALGKQVLQNYENTVERLADAGSAFNQIQQTAVEVRNDAHDVERATTGLKDVAVEIRTAVRESGRLQQSIEEAVGSIGTSADTIGSSANDIRGRLLSIQESVGRAHEVSTSLQAELEKARS